MADDDLIASVPSVAGPAAATAPPSYLGLPPNYITNPRPQTITHGVGGYAQGVASSAPPPTPYRDGDVLAPSESMSPEMIARLQQRMAAAGLYGGKNAIYRNGLWDAASQNAYEQALTYANQNGINVDYGISELASHPLPKDPTTVEPGKIDKVTGAQTLEAQVQSAAEKRLGRRLRGSELTRFVTLYQGLERKDNAAYNAAQDTAAAGTDTTFTSTAPTADVAADDFITSNNGQEAASQDAYGYFDALKGMLGG